MNPFDVANDISYNKKNIITADNESLYPAFMVNRSLSYHTDCILHVNLCNQYASDMTNQMQYDYLAGSVRKKKRYAKWAKATKDEDVMLVARHFNVGLSVAKQYLPLMSPEQLTQLKKKKQKYGNNH